MTWLILAGAIVIACAMLAVALVVTIGLLDGVPRPNFRRRKRTGTDGNSGK